MVLLPACLPRKPLERWKIKAGRQREATGRCCCCVARNRALLSRHYIARSIRKWQRRHNE
uniref:Uncharacterized protein n=1 Tax=Anopheles albimanus TaxID=7167 RepID=A0A182FYT3_ANOAL